MMNGDLRYSFVRLCIDRYMKRSVLEVHAARHRLKAEEGGAPSVVRARVVHDGLVTGGLSIDIKNRFLDMGVKPGFPLGKMVRDADGVVVRAVRPKKVYAKPVYGGLGRFLHDLRVGYTEQFRSYLSKRVRNG